MGFHYFHFSPSVFFLLPILALYLDTGCVGLEISYFSINHMSKYLVYQGRYRQESLTPKPSYTITIESLHYPKAVISPLFSQLRLEYCERAH